MDNNLMFEMADARARREMLGATEQEVLQRAQEIYLEDQRRLATTPNGPGPGPDGWPTTEVIPAK